MKIFSANKSKQVLGGRIESGTIKKGSDVKIFRRDNEIGSGTVKDLQQNKTAVSEITEGNEFGAMIDSKIEIVAGDSIRLVTMVKK